MRSLPGRLSLPVVWTFYLVWPVPGWGLFGGLPLTAPALVALCLVWWGWVFAPPSTAGRNVMLVMLLLKIGRAPFLCGHGLVASYFANDAWRPPVEESTEYAACKVHQD